MRITALCEGLGDTIRLLNAWHKVSREVVMDCRSFILSFNTRSDGVVAARGISACGQLRRVRKVSQRRIRMRVDNRLLQIQRMNINFSLSDYGNSDGGESSHIFHCITSFR